MTISITDINGIGPNTAKTLADHGIKTVQNLARASVGKLTKIPGFSEARSIQVKQDATSLLQAKSSKVSTSGKTKESAEKTKKTAEATSAVETTEPQRPGDDTKVKAPKPKIKKKGKKGKKGKKKKGKKKR